MSKKTITLVGFVAVLAMAVTFLHAATPKDPGEGKFHLVYLVSVVDLKPGSKVFVDPVFFTDGKQIKSFHDYCRSYLKAPEKRKGVWKMTPAPHQIAGDLTPMHAYCENKPVTVHAEKFHTLNNTGLSIGLSSASFSPSTAGTNYVGAHELFPHPGVATLTGVSDKTLVIEMGTESASRPRHFLLMSSNGRVLERILPVQRLKTDEMNLLIDVARRYAEEAKGRYRRGNEERRRSPGFESAKPEIVNALIADLDGDGVADAVIGMTAQSERSHWGGLAFLYSKSGRFFLGDLWQLSNYQSLMLPYGYVDHAPLALIRSGDCSYILSMLTELGKSYQLLSQPKPSKGCQDLNLTRIEEPVVD